MNLRIENLILLIVAVLWYSESVQTLINIVIVASLAYIMNTYVFTMARVEGRSMFPTYRHGQYVLVAKFAIIDDGDVIVFKLPTEEHTFVKRVDHMVEDEYYVLGDNTNNSKDSRHYGLIKKEYIIGRVVDFNNL